MNGGDKFVIEDGDVDLNVLLRFQKDFVDEIGRLLLQERRFMISFRAVETSLEKQVLVYDNDNKIIDMLNTFEIDRMFDKLLGEAPVDCLEYFIKACQHRIESNSAGSN